jgi:hypothetical protein
MRLSFWFKCAVFWCYVFLFQTESAAFVSHVFYVWDNTVLMCILIVLLCERFYVLKFVLKYDVLF